MTCEYAFSLAVPWRVDTHASLHGRMIAPLDPRAQDDTMKAAAMKCMTMINMHAAHLVGAPEGVRLHRQRSARGFCAQKPKRIRTIGTIFWADGVPFSPPPFPPVPRRLLYCRARPSIYCSSDGTGPQWLWTKRSHPGHEPRVPSSLLLNG